MRQYLPTDSLVYKNIQSNSDQKIVFLSGLGLEIKKQREAFIRRFALNHGVSYLALDYTRYTDEHADQPYYNLLQVLPRTMAILNQDNKKLLLCGACFGGLMALRIAAQMPKRVQAVLALSPPYETLGYSWIDNADSFLKKRENDLKQRNACPEIIQKMVAFRNVVISAFQILGREKIEPTFRKPVHILHGQNDKLIPAENSLHVQQALNNPNCTVHITPKAGHTLNNDYEMKIPIRILEECLHQSCRPNP